MRFPLSMTLLSMAGAAVSVGACGPNVILDAMSSSSGSGGNGSTRGMAFGGSTTGFGVGGAAVTNTVGTGGGFSSTASLGPGGPAPASSTATAGTGGGSVITISTGSTMMACTDGPDEMFLDAKLLYPTLVKCTTKHSNDPDGLANCIQSKTGLSTPCINCISGDVQCGLKNCVDVCGSDPNGDGCTECRDKSCEKDFLGCSGLSYAPGSVSCSDVLFDGTKGKGWKLGVPAEAFVTTPGFQDYNIVLDCACGLLPEGCQSVCDDANTNGPPEFCNGAVASPKCLMCLETNCGGQLMLCQGN